MSSCRECIHHVVCAVYAPNLDDVLAKGESCLEFKNTDIAKEIFEKLYKNIKFDGHSVAVWEKDLRRIAKEYNVNF